MNSRLSICILIVSLQLYNNAPINQELQQNERLNARALDFLESKGYLRTLSEIGEIQAQDNIKEAIENLQDFAGIPKTGVVDNITWEYIVKPRCGMPDMHQGEPIAKRKKRFALHGSSWRDTRVTWALENSNNDGISDFDVRRTMKRSFDKWEAITNLQFIELVNKPIASARIRVRFEIGQHGDQYAFDGRGGTLAHAFYPHSNEGLSGDCHFDDDEIYTIDMNADQSKRKLLWVAVHELGHSIGLEHSKLKGAVMYPWYQHFEGDDFDLTADDILGAQSIYGSKAVTTPTAETKPTPKTKSVATLPPTKCITDMKAVFLDQDRSPWVINNDQVYILHVQQPGVKVGPESVKKYFKKLDRVDGVFRRGRDDALVFFHGDQFTVYDGMTLKQASRKISDGFQGLPDGFSDIDATFVYSVNNKLYLFKGEQYWRFTQLSNLDYLKDGGYPQAIASSWNGLPNSIDAAFQWNNKKLYFVKGSDYYRWDDKLNRVHSGYPIKNVESFLACYSNSGQLLDTTDHNSHSSAIHLHFHYALQTLFLFYYAFFILT